MRRLLEISQELTCEYDLKLSEAQALIAELKRELFGPKADRLTSDQQDKLEQLNRDMEDENRRPQPTSREVLVDDEDVGKGTDGKSRARHPLPVHLEVETKVIEPELGPCPCCGKMPTRIGEEVTEEIDLIPAKVIRRRIVRPKYACGCGEAGVAIAPLPPRLIPASRLGLGLAVHITLARFDDHLSFYRLEQQFRERHGLVIPRSQMVQWVEQIATWLRPVYDTMWRRMLKSGYMQVDETPVRVKDPEVQGKTARGYLWFYAVPRGDVLLAFESGRGLGPIRDRLRDFSGTIQTDAYEVYQSLLKVQPGLQRIGCLAHSRRRFYQALHEDLADAVWFISKIRLLYEIEAEIRDLAPEKRYDVRLERAPAIWKSLKSRAEELKPGLLPQSTMGKAVNYFLNEYEALIGYLRDGRFEIDNNLVENSIRPTAVGRKRWLFIGHPEAGWRSAVIYSIIGSCRRRGINPQDYLTDVLQQLPSTTINRVGELTPENWKSPSSNTS